MGNLIPPLGYRSRYPAQSKARNNMFASEFSIADIERVGPVIESLLESGKLTADERSAVDLCGRAAADLAMIRHSEAAVKFYAREDVESRTANSTAEWLSLHADAEPGTVTAIAGRIHVAYYDRDGGLQLTPVRDL